MDNAMLESKEMKMSEPTAYEDLVRQLESTVGRLENEPLGLEQALDLYEEGHRLLRQAQDRLTGLEGRMERLLADGSRQDIEIEGS